MIKKFPVKITKMSGAGNTFAIIDGTNNPSYPNDWIEAEKLYKISRPDFAKRICDRTLGISTDGLLIIENGSFGFDFDWDFYNSDGSFAEMCGNAVRCAALYCAEQFNPKIKTIKFKTGAGLVSAEVLTNNKIQVKMPESKILDENILLDLQSGRTESFFFTNTGVPHLVKRVQNIAEAVSLKEIARECRWHAKLGPSGSNVTFYSINQSGIDAVSFERGVEDYTLACGTGAVAAAMVYRQNSSVLINEVRVTMPGGGLDIHFMGSNLRPLMSGEALFIGDFQYNLEVIT